MEMSTYHNQHGATLIELVIFLIIIGIVTTGVSGSLLVALRSGNTIQKNQEATEYGQMRMELIQGQRIIYGFDNFDDPCDSSPGLDICDSGDYTITTSINSWHDNGWPGSSSDYKKITVTVDDSDGNQLAELESIVSDSPPS